MKKLLFILCILPTLQACVPTALVAGATAGGAIIYDNRSMKTMLQDRNISYQTQMRINTDPLLKGKTHISVATFNHVVLIVGQAPTVRLRNRALAIVRSFPKIKRIYNQITLDAPTSLLTRSSDSIVTAKVKTEMLTKKGLESTQMKVITENGVVYLMGLTTPNQGRLAANVARKVSGVRKVVKLFEYTH